MCVCVCVCVCVYVYNTKQYIREKEDVEFCEMSRSGMSSCHLHWLIQILTDSSPISPPHLCKPKPPNQFKSMNKREKKRRGEDRGGKPFGEKNNVDGLWRSSVGIRNLETHISLSSKKLLHSATQHLTLLNVKTTAVEV